VVNVNVRQQERVDSGNGNRRSGPIPRLKLPLLKHPAVDHDLAASDLEAIAAASDLAIGTEEVEFHGMTGGASEW
jgi:hypothetical protein